MSEPDIPGRIARVAVAVVIIVVPLIAGIVVAMAGVVQYLRDD